MQCFVCASNACGNIHSFSRRFYPKRLTIEEYNNARVHTAWFSKSSDHCCFHTARLSGVAFSRCCVHIARWIGYRRFHTAWLYNRKNRRQLCLHRNYSQTYTQKCIGNNARSRWLYGLEVLPEHTIINTDDLLTSILLLGNLFIHKSKSSPIESEKSFYELISYSL